MKRFKKEELKSYLKENYSNKRKVAIIEDLGLSWRYIQKKAHLFGLKREFSEHSNRKNDLSKLLKLDNISCYWIGFLLADGHISKKNTLIINLSIKDLDYFKNIENHLKITLDIKLKEKTNSFFIVLYDAFVIVKLKKIFFWTNNKTKNPPIIPNFLTNDQLFSLIIGFIDGDGSIGEKGEIAIRCDLSWKKILEDFHLFLTGYHKDAYVTKDNLSLIVISKKRILKKIKQRILNLSLPIMKRKWSKLKIDNIVDNCLNCGKILKGDSKKKYCSNKCLYQFKQSIKERDIDRDSKRSLNY